MSTTNNDPLKRTARLFKIVTLIFERELAEAVARAGGEVHGSRLGRPELARLCGCDIKTIGRDLGLLRTLVELKYDKIHKTYHIAEKNWRFPITPLTAADVLALALARGLLAAPGLPHAEAIQRALEKTTAALPPALRDILDQAAGAFTSPSLPRDYSAAPVDALMQASTARLTVEIDYESRSRGARKIRKIDPYLVAPRDGIYWELHGWCHDNAAIRTFALDRVFRVETTSDPFVWRADEWKIFEQSRDAAIGGLHGGSANGSRTYTVDVRFLHPAAAYARDHRWPGHLKIASDDRTPDGDSDGAVRLIGTIERLDGLLVELLRWKRHARILGGPELRAAYRAELQAMLAANPETGPDSSFDIENSMPSPP